MTESQAQLQQEKKSLPLDDKSIDSIRFDFKAKIIGDITTTKNIRSTYYVEIDASLFNGYSDTIYFLTTMCFGEQYSLQYDTAKFTVKPLALCFSNGYKIAKITPKGTYNFKGAFNFKNELEDKIKLGYDFYRVDKNLDLTKVQFHKIHDRPENEKTVVWAEEKHID